MRWSWLLLVGCYHSDALAPCATRCTDEARTCPDGQLCGDDGLCHGPEVVSCTSDASVAVDAPDAAPDAAIDAPWPCYAVGLAPQFRPVCFDPATIAATLALPGRIYTDTDALCRDWQQASGQEPDVCLIVANDISVSPGAMVWATGKRTLAIVATHDLIIAAGATLDVGSESGIAGAGAGQGTNACGAAVTPPGTIGSCSAGGAGGSFLGMGGAGGASYNHGNQPGTVAPPLPRPAFLRGGCPGSDGAFPNSVADGSGRPGGGGLYLVAGDTLQIAGVVSAGGAGGYYGTTINKGGAGGGGSGGMIALEAPHVSLLGGASVDANGGGGGGGDSDVMNGSLFGGPGQYSHDANVALGGVAGTDAGKGGNGSLGGDGSPGEDSVTQCGGGGGGGAGYILVFSPDLTGTGFSPAPTVNP